MQAEQQHAMGTAQGARDLTQHPSPPLVASDLLPDCSSAAALPSSAISVGGNSDEQHESGERERCVRNGCPNLAAESRVWDNEYCSSECLVAHCRDVFRAWVEERKVAPGNLVQ